MSNFRTILHVDDDEDILEITRMALQVVDDFDVRQYSSGPEALAALDDFTPDMLLLDVMMPGMTGPELWDEICKRPGGRDIPAIFVTAKAESKIKDELRARGALDVITKPFDPMALGSKLRAAWAEQ